MHQRPARSPGTHACLLHARRRVPITDSHDRGSQLQPTIRRSTTSSISWPLRAGGFPIANKDEAEGHTVFKARFVDEIRHVGTPQAKFKSQFIVHAFQDDAQGLLTYAPTVQRLSQRIILHVAAEDLENLIIFLRDTVQAYTQATATLRRIIYIILSPISVFHLMYY